MGVGIENTGSTGGQQGSPLGGLILLVVVVAVGYWGISAFTQTDREELRGCFDAIRASNPEYFGIDMRIRIQELNAAEKVEIISRDRTKVVTVVRYALDRKPGEVWCPN
jgi:hypothetical protein